MLTFHKTQNGTMLHKACKAAAFFTIVLGLLIVPRAAGQNGVAVLGPNGKYACTTAGIISAISDAVAAASGNPNTTTGTTQPVVDASNCVGNPTANPPVPGLVLTQPIYVGARPGGLGQRIKLILPANGLWQTGSTWSDPNNYGYAFMWGNGAMIYGGTGSGEGQPFTILHTGLSGTTLTAVCGNDPDNLQGSRYFHAEGFSCAAGAAVQAAVLEINFSQDESYVGHVTAIAETGAHVPRVVWIHAACCSATFEDINAEGSNNSYMGGSTVPCVFGDLNTAIHVSKVSCVHPGPGQSAVQILQSSGSPQEGNSFRDIYMEQSTSTSDTMTPWVLIEEINGAYPATDLLDGFRAGLDRSGSSRYVVDIGGPPPNPTGVRVNISNLGLGSVSTNAIIDRTNGVTVTGNPLSTIAGYDMTPRYGLTLGALTVGTLPPAASNPGAMFRVTDSTGISSEGQNCRGGGGTIALAFSNGSGWKCF